jgi:hypothetical protein
VGLMAGLDWCGKSRPPPTGIRSPDRPARSESLYRLSCRGPPVFGIIDYKFYTCLLGDASPVFILCTNALPYGR